MALITNNYSITLKERRKNVWLNLHALLHHMDNHYLLYHDDLWLSVGFFNRRKNTVKRKSLLVRKSIVIMDSEMPCKAEIKINNLMMKLFLLV